MRYRLQRKLGLRKRAVSRFLMVINTKERGLMKTQARKLSPHFRFTQGIGVQKMGGNFIE